VVEINYYYDSNFNLDPELKPFTHQASANPGTKPPKNALRTAPPLLKTPAEGDPRPFPPGKWAAVVNGAWQTIEDHREEEGFVDCQPFTIKNFGPYPDGWSAVKPPPTAEEIKRETISQLQAELNGYDFKSIRSMRTIESLRAYINTFSEPSLVAGLETEIASEADFLAQIEDKATEARNKLKGLQG
jgi:hypothetical protein